MTDFSPLPEKLNAGFWIFKGSLVWAYVSDFNAKPEDPGPEEQARAIREYCRLHKLNLQNIFADTMRVQASRPAPIRDMFFSMMDGIKRKDIERPEAILIYKPIIFERADSSGKDHSKAIKNRNIFLHSITVAPTEGRQ